MNSNLLNIKLTNIRAIKKANITLDGITVIAGENGCGKSTISKLVYHLINSSIEFDKIVDRKLSEDLNRVYRTLDQISRELSYFADKEEYLKIRNSFRKQLYRNDYQLELFEEDNLITSINSLIEIFTEAENNIQNGSQTSKRHFERIKMILCDSLGINNNKEIEIKNLFSKLIEVINNNIEKSNKIKESRPLSIVNDKISEAFYDSSLPQNFNLYEYGIPIIDRQDKKVIPIHSIQNVAYIDTPMVLGLDFLAERPHWDELNAILSRKKLTKTSNELDAVFKDEILKGDISIDEQELSNKTFIYKRNDGKEFDLLECATGLKSFSVLQLLYKNGFLNNSTLLIIDEPEVHLHPQWVVEYARLIVLLNKKIGVKFLIASHHPDMISAIKYISEKEQASSNLHFYLAQQDKNTFTYNYIDLGVEIDEIFSSFNIALERIDLYGRTE